MKLSSLPTLLPFAVIAALLVLPGTAAAFDDLNDATLGDAPWTSGEIFTGTTAVFSNASYTLEGEETDAPTVFLGCGSWGSKDAWVRFRTGVAGNLRVTVDSSIPGPSGYDVFYKVWLAPGAIPPGQVGYDDLTERACFNGSTGPDESYVFGHELVANVWVYVQTLSLCRSGPALPYCSPQEQSDAPGGSTTINLRFTPKDTDADSRPDTLDNCPALANAGQEDQDGDGTGDACDDDRDGDGRANAGDNCPTLANAGQGDQDGDGAGDACDEDRDGDAFPNDSDCAPDNPAINPAAQDRPGNRIDENCDRTLAPYPRVSNSVTPETQVITGTNNVRTWRRFTVEGVRKGMRVRIECNGGNCPYSKKTHRVRRSASAFSVGREFKGRKQLVGTKVTIKLMRAGFMGRVVGYTIRRRGRPKGFIGCIPAPNQAQPVQRKCEGIGGR